jgi:hypothetical protein
VFSGTENILRNSKYNLPFADANKIPLGRDWVLAPLTCGLKILAVELAVTDSALIFCLFFRIGKTCFLN